MLDINIILDYIKSELLILIPVLYAASKFLNNISLSKNKVSVIIFFSSIILTGMYIFTTTKVCDWREIVFAIFTSIVQGVLISEGTALSNTAIKKIKDKKEQSDIKKNSN